MSVHRADGPSTAPPADQLRETQQRTATRSAGRTAPQGDSLDLSPRAREAERLRQIAVDLEDVRAERVADAKQGPDRVDSQELARLLLDDVI